MRKGGDLIIPPGGLLRNFESGKSWKRCSRIRVFCLVVIVTAIGCRLMPQETQTTKSVDQAETGQVVLQPASSTEVDDFFVGSARCSACHSTIYREWEQTAHAIRFDPDVSSPHTGDCIRCHTTSPQESAVGCESCHGPLGTHAANPETMRKPSCRLCDIRVECIRCHTRSIDPQFSFSTAYPHVKHEKRSVD